MPGVMSGYGGQMPQTFSHLALINAVMYLIREDELLGDAAFRAPAA